MNVSEVIFTGIRGYALALSRSTGQELWRTDLKGAEFVNLVLDGDRLLAATKGEIFCLSPNNGEILWRNRLPGLGLGVVSMVTVRAPEGTAAGPEEKRRQDATNRAVIAAT